MKQKLISICLSLALCLSLLPLPAAAEELSADTPAAEAPETAADRWAEGLEEVRAMLAALPAPAELEAAGEETLLTAYDAAQTAADAYEALLDGAETAEQAAQAADLPGLDRLAALMDWFNGQTAPLADCTDGHTKGEDGKCSVCQQPLVKLEINGGEAYVTLTEAVAALSEDDNSPVVITLLTDVGAESTTLELPKGHFLTLYLNGWTLTGSITVQGKGANGAGGLEVVGGISQNIGGTKSRINGAITVKDNGGLTIDSGTTVAGKVTVETINADIKLDNDVTLETGIKAPENGDVSVGEYLYDSKTSGGKTLYYYEKTTQYSDEFKDFVTVYTIIPGYGTVKEITKAVETGWTDHTHTISDGACSVCGALCPHEGWSGSGTCTDCGQAVTAKVTYTETLGSNPETQVTKYFSDLNAAMRAMIDTDYTGKDYVLTLLDSGTLLTNVGTGADAKYQVPGSTRSCTVDLNGKTLRVQTAGGTSAPLTLPKGTLTVKNGTLNAASVSSGSRMTLESVKLGTACPVSSNGTKLTLSGTTETGSVTLNGGGLTIRDSVKVNGDVTVSGSTKGTLTINGPVTVTGSVSATGEGTMSHALTLAGPTEENKVLSIGGGVTAIKSELTVSGNVAVTGALSVTNQNRGKTVTLSGGTFNGGIELTNSASKKCTNLLAEGGYIYQKKTDENADWTSVTYEAAEVTTLTGSVRVVKCTNHAGTGSCTYCNQGLSVSVTTPNSEGGSSTKDYPSLEEALAAVKDTTGAAVKLLASQDGGRTAITMPSGTYTLDLGGFDLTCGSLTVDTGANVTLTNGDENYGSVKPNDVVTVNGALTLGQVTLGVSYSIGTKNPFSMTVSAGGTLTARAGSAINGDVTVSGTASFEKSTANTNLSDPTVAGALTVESGGAVTVEGGSFSGGLRVNGGTATLSGGSFQSITVAEGNTVAGLLAEGKSFTNGGTYDPGDGTSLTAAEGQSIGVGSVLLRDLTVTFTAEGVTGSQTGGFGWEYGVTPTLRVVVNPVVTDAGIPLAECSWTLTKADGTIVASGTKTDETHGGAIGVTGNGIELGTLSKVGAGSYTLTVTAKASNGYPVTATVPITVNGKTLTDYTAPTENNEPDYDGTTAYPLVVPGILLKQDAKDAGVKFLFRLDGSEAWSETPPTATDPGSYKVYWYIDGGDSYNDVGSPDSPGGLVKVNWNARVGTETALRTAIANNWSPIRLTGDIALTGGDTGSGTDLRGGLVIGTGKDITLDLSGHLLSLASGNTVGSVILVKGGKLTLEDSQPTAEHTGITVKGGAILCTDPSPDNSIVAVYADGTNRGSFTMRGGTLAGCNGSYSGVYVQGSDFNMTGGTVTGCTADQGGGVYLTEGSTFTLNGGTISSCTANKGGGVFLTNGSTFTLKTGTVTGCTAKENGGGVYAEGIDSKDSTFNMTGGTVTGCTANLGGGVYTLSRSSSRGILCMSGGTVTGCTVVRNDEIGNDGCGSGVYLYDNSSGASTVMYANGGTVAGDVYVNACRISRDADGSNPDTYTTFSGRVEFREEAGVDDAAALAVTFDPAGGTPAPAVQRVLKGQKAAAPTAPARSGYTFGGWYQGETQWSFDTAVTDALTLTANWTATGGGSSSGGSSSGGSSSGGSSSGSSAGTPAAPAAPVTPVTPGTTVTVPVSSDKGSVNVKAEITGTDGGAATATVEISDQEIEQVAQNRSGSVTVDMSGLDVASATVPAHVVDTTNRAEETGLTVALPSGSVSLDETALESVTTGQDITVSVQQVPATDLTEEQQKTVGDMANIGLVVDVDLTVGETKQSTFNGGKLTVSVPYTPKRGEDVSRLTVWFIRDDGTIENKGGCYDAARGCFVFETEHLSRYVLVYSDRAVSFTDVPPTAYFAGAVAWAVRSGVTGGVTETAFAPYASCTRAQIVTFLWRAAGSPEPETTENPFTDVSPDAYYYRAVLWAVERGITGGIGGGSFAPDAPCTRAQAVTLLYRSEQANGGGFTGLWMFRLPFTDVPEWCYEAVAWCYKEQITGGISETSFAPGSVCTRAQIVTFLYRMLGQ